MQGLKAHVRSGRIVVDEPTDLPEGSELELVVVGNDALDEEDQRELSALLELALDDEDAGRKVNTEAFLEEVRALACR
jgi:hypothetical protein